MPQPTASSKGKVLGILKPMGGGDPIPLTKPEVVIGRRRSCDICLDFNNISGKHCQLRLINSVWHVRDLGSTNGTSLNGVALGSEHNVLPDDELSIASHLFTIDYEPGGPDAVLQMHDVLEETSEEPRRHSLLELAGIDNDEDRPRHRGRPTPTQAPAAEAQREQPAASAVPASPFQDEIPRDFKPAATPTPKVNDDDDFLKIFEEEVKPAGKKPGGR